MIRFFVTRPGFLSESYETIEQANAEASRRRALWRVPWFVEARDLEEADPPPEPGEVLAELEGRACRQIRWAGVAP